MKTQKLMTKGMVFILGYVVILTTAFLDHYGNHGEYLKFGYMIGVICTLWSRSVLNTVFVTFAAFFLIVFPLVFVEEPEVFRTTLISGFYAALGILFALVFVLRGLYVSDKFTSKDLKMDYIFASAKQGIVLVEDNRVISCVNPFLAAIFDYELDEMVGLKIEDIVPDLQLEDLFKQNPDADFRVELSGIKKGGSAFPIEILVGTCQSKKSMLFVMFVNDISLRRQNEQIINDKTKELESVNRELESFSYSVSHDLKAPLRAIDGFSKILEEDYSNVLDAEGKRLLAMIQKGTTRMNDLINDLLAFSKLGQKEPEKVLVNMTELTQHIVHELTLGKPNTPKIIVEKLNPTFSDPSLISQVLINLISNAIKYSSRQEKPEIRIESFNTLSQTVYSVSDNGDGFDMNFAQKLFGVFQRLHTNDEFEGTGLGLAISQRIIHKHSGQIWAEAEKGKGATFYFSLPIYTKQNPSPLQELQPKIA